jgi:5-methylcytosine-specific restriction endonuclease McrA
MNIWRLNVRETQIDECVNSYMFAVDRRPRNPEIQRGDLLLLQLVLSDAKKRNKENKRIEYALIFDHYAEDYDGTISRYYWPMAGKTWRWILYCSEIVTTIPFSLENLPLSTSYAGQTNPIKINERDVAKITPFLLRYYQQPVEEIGSKIHRIREEIPSPENVLWDLIRNNDRIVEEAPDKIEWRTVPATREIKRNPEIPYTLKELYNFKCQICEHDFKPRYGQAYSETHHIIALSRGGVDHSNNLIVVCPNHHRIIHEAKPVFDRSKLAFVYRNGLQEHLQLKNHFKDLGLLEKIRSWSSGRCRTIEKEKL